MRLKIRVTQEHINRGVKNSPHCCPIAQAIGSAKTPGGLRVYSRYVFGCDIGFSVGGKQMKIVAPVRATRFIRRFDALGRHAVKPFNFFINIPEGTL